MASNLASPSFMYLVEKHFNESITFGNELKPDYVLDQAASQASGDNTNPQVNFAQADALHQERHGMSGNTVSGC